MKLDYHIKIECSASDEEAEALYQDIRLLMQKYNEVVTVEKCDFWSQVASVLEFKTTELDETANSQLEKLEKFIHEKLAVGLCPTPDEKIVDTAIRLLKNVYLDVPQKEENKEDFTSNKYQANYDKLKSMIAIDPSPPEW